MKGGKYTKTLAKTQVTRTFRMRDIRRNAYLNGHQHGGRKPTKTSVTEFWYKSVNLFLEELINIEVTVFLIHELFR